MYDKLVAGVNNIDTSGFVLKTKSNTDKSDLEKKIVMETKKILMLLDLLKLVSRLATNAPLTAVENKTPDVSNLLKKQIMTQKLVKLKTSLLIIIMINILLHQNSLS